MSQLAIASIYQPSQTPPRRSQMIASTKTIQGQSRAALNWRVGYSISRRKQAILHLCI